MSVFTWTHHQDAARLAKLPSSLAHYVIQTLWIARKRLTLKKKKKAIL